MARASPTSPAANPTAPCLLGSDQFAYWDSDGSKSVFLILSRSMIFPCDHIINGSAFHRAARVFFNEHLYDVEPVSGSFGQM
jgi:hypothetical protein